MTRLPMLLTQLVLATSIVLSTATQAVAGASSASPDGKLIDQAKVLAGGLTSGDTPGFPLTISEPGLYRLAGNLTVTDPNVDAIQITGDHVTLDLNGFSILGPVHCTGSGGSMNCSPSSANGSGIRATIGRHFSVRAGSIKGFGNGVTAGSLARVEDLNIAGIAGNGISSGPSSMVFRSVVSMAQVGISSAGMVRDNVVTGTRNVGIYVQAPGHAIGNTVTGSGGTGLHLLAGSAAAFNFLTLNDGYSISGQGISMSDGMTNLCGATAKC